MKKIIIAFVALLVLGVGAFYFLSYSPKKNENQSQPLEQVVFEKTYNISKEYVALRYQTDNVMIEAEKYPDYEKWNSAMSNIINNWKNMEKKGSELEKLAEEMSREKTSFNFVESSLAYDKQEISNVFDAAPAGKKIVTLAQYLGVDAKKAALILQQDQAQVTADAWNEAGDTFQTLETGAVAIKDGCKIAGFVGGIAVSGGTSAVMAGTSLSKAVVIVSGADLVLEVSDDGANIALGNYNKVSSIIQTVRKGTAPVANLLALTDLPNNLKNGFEKFNAVMLGADQLNSAVQEGSVIGIQVADFIKEEKQPLQVSVVKPNEVDKWIKDSNIKTDAETKENVEKVLGLVQTEVTNNQNQKNDPPKKEPATVKENIPEVETSTSAIGTWKGTLSQIATADGKSKKITFDWVLELGDNQKVKLSSKETSGVFGNISYDFSSWEQEGDSVKLYGEGDKENYFEFKLQGNSLVFLKTVLLGKESLAGEKSITGGTTLEGTLNR